MTRNGFYLACAKYCTFFE